MSAVWTAPVRYGECDAQGVVFNAHYLAWADEAMTALLTQLGTPYEGLLARGLDTAVVASTLTWTAPARWGDVVAVDGEVERIGRTSFTAAFAISAGERSCCTVRTTYVLYGPGRAPVAVPDDLRGRWLSPSAAP